MVHFPAEANEYCSTFILPAAVLPAHNISQQKHVSGPCIILYYMDSAIGVLLAMKYLDARMIYACGIMINCTSGIMM